MIQDLALRLHCLEVVLMNQSVAGKEAPLKNATPKKTQENMMLQRPRGEDA